jgi:hypothetical protein
MTSGRPPVTTGYAGFGYTAVAGPDTVVLLAMDPAADFVAELWALVSDGASWDDVIGVLLRGGIVALPAMGLVHRDGESTTVLLRGAMTATVSTSGSAPEVMNGARVTTWTERPFEGVTSVEFAGNPVADSEGRLPLAAGVVRAAVVRRNWGPTSATPPLPAEPEQLPVAPSPPVALPPVVVSTPGPPAEDPAALGDHDHRTRPSERPRSPRAQPERTANRVSAVRCPDGHLNPPIAERCRICDAILADDQIPVEIEQPPVGHLRMVPNGPVFPLRGRVLVGREPRWEGRGTSLGDGSSIDVAFFVIESPERTISRTHVEIRVTGWTVEAIDVSSSYTEVTNPGVPALRLRRGSPAVILPGAHLVLADDVTLRYEVGE